MIIVILVYLAGYIASYFMFKAAILEGFTEMGYFSEWTISDRIMALVIALLSWFGFFMNLILWVLEKYDKAAKW